MIGKIDVYHTGPRTSPGGSWARVDARGSACSFFTRGKIQHPFLHLSDVWREGSTFILPYPLWLPILSSVSQVISLRDQIKRRQQGVDGGKDVREGFTHVGSSHFCVCVSIQKVCSEVDVWVQFCCGYGSFRRLWSSLFTTLIYFSPSCLSSGYPMVLPLVWKIVS